MHSSRRFFLRAAALAGSAFALPSCSSAAPRPKKRHDEKLKLLVIGTGGRGAGNVDGVRSEDIVAVCDIDRLQLARSAKDFPNAQQFVDFRRALELPGLDGVVISTPDHTHFPAAMMALGLRLLGTTPGCRLFLDTPLGCRLFIGAAFGLSLFLGMPLGGGFLQRALPTQPRGESTQEPCNAHRLHTHVPQTERRSLSPPFSSPS
jgi:hypothetical protein